MSKYIVVTKNGLGEDVPLRGTIWAFEMARAQTFDSREAAQVQLDKAKQFMKVKTYKSARIIEVKS